MVTNVSLENLVGGKWTPKMYIDFKELIGDDEKENLEIELQKINFLDCFNHIKDQKWSADDFADLLEILMSHDLLSSKIFDDSQLLETSLAQLKEGSLDFYNHFKFI